MHAHTQMGQRKEMSGKWLLSNRAGYLGCSLTFFWALHFLVAVRSPPAPALGIADSSLPPPPPLPPQAAWKMMGDHGIRMLLGRSSHLACARGTWTEGPHPPGGHTRWPRRRLGLGSSLRAGNSAGSQWKLSKTQKFVVSFAYIASQCLNCLRSDCGPLCQQDTVPVFQRNLSLPASHKISWIENGWRLEVCLHNLRG